MLSRTIKVVLADEVEAARLGWQVVDPGTDDLAPRAAKRSRPSGLPSIDRHHAMNLADEPHGIFEFVFPFGADEEYILRGARRHVATALRLLALSGHPARAPVVQLE